MLSNQDYKNYLEQLFTLEDSMFRLYSQCFDSLEDEDFKKIMMHLVEDEKNHSCLLKDLEKIFTE